jgi:hypothetical protein
MKRIELLVAFALGWITVIAIGLVADTLAQRGNNNGQNAVQNRIKVLQERVGTLEQMAAAGKLLKQFVAPFEVVDQNGKRLFYVSQDRDVEFYKDGKRVSVMSAGGDVGTLWTLTSTPDLWASITAERLRINESGQVRMELGQHSTGTYRVLFYSKDAKKIAGIGELPETHNGQVYVLDSSGSLKARMAVGDDDKGLVDVWGGTAPNVLARLGQRTGGYFMICAADICDPPMVEAGDGGGFGVVRTGPLMYQPGVGLTGVPQSFLEGKH